MSLTPDEVLRAMAADLEPDVFGMGERDYPGLARQLLVCREALRYYGQQLSPEYLGPSLVGPLYLDQGAKARACLPEHQGVKS